MNMQKAQTPSGIASVEECDAFLAAHPEVENVQIFFTNQSGVPRGKNLRRRDIRAVFENARMIPGTMLALDITGADVEASGLVMSDGDADRYGKPVPGTLTPAPWLGPDFAQVMLSIYELDGSPCDVDPRHVLKSVIDRFEEFDLTPVVACELEFYLMDRALPEGGGRQGAVSPVTGHRSDHVQAYGLRELDDFQPFLNDLYAMARRPACRWNPPSPRTRRGSSKSGWCTARMPSAPPTRPRSSSAWSRAPPQGTASRRPSWPNRITVSPAAASTCMSAWPTATARMLSPARTRPATSC